MPQPAPFPKNDSEEQDAIKCVHNAIDTSFVKAEIRSRDKYPNVDGTLEIVDENAVPQGKFDVQVKKLPKGASSFQCPVELYAYSKVSSLPVLLLVCDTSDKKVYWKQICFGMPEYKENQKTFIVKFTSMDLIGPESGYLEKWRSVLIEYSRRIAEYPGLASRIAKELDLKDIPNEDVTYFQEFTRELNGLLTGDFQIIKERMLPKFSQLGVAIIESSKESIKYQIQKMHFGDRTPLVVRSDETNIFSYSGPNVVQSVFSRRSDLKPPRERALEYLSYPIKEAISRFRFSIHGSELSQNTICGFLQKYPNCFGLPCAEKYQLKEIETAFYKNLPSSLQYYLLHTPAQSINNVPSINLWEVESFFKWNTIPKKTLHNNPYTFILNSDDISLRAFADALQYIQSIGLDEVSNPWENMGKRKGPMIWMFENAGKSESNIRSLLQNLIANYSKFIIGNNLKLVNSPYLRPDIAIIYRFSVDENSNGPILHEYHIENTDLEFKRIVLMPKDPRWDDNNLIHDTILFCGKKYKYISHSTGLASWMFKDFPYLRGIYKMLSSDLSSHYGYNINTVY